MLNVLELSGQDQRWQGRPGVTFHWALGCDLGCWSGSWLGGACSSGAMERLTMGGMWPP